MIICVLIPLGINQHIIQPVALSVLSVWSLLPALLLYNLTTDLMDLF